MEIWYEIDTYKGQIIPLHVEKRTPQGLRTTDGYLTRFSRDKHFKTFEAAHAKLKEKAEYDLKLYREWTARAEATIAALTTGVYASKPDHYAAMEDEVAGITVGSDAHLARAIATGT